jgi:hypothetical protein
MKQMTEVKKEEDLKSVTKDEIYGKVLSVGRKIVKTAIIAAVLYATLVPAGLVLGGIAGGMIAGHFGAGYLLTAGAAVLGVGVGGVGGFFGTKLAVAGMVEDIVTSGGLEAGEMGLRSLLKTLRDAKKNAKDKGVKPAMGVETLESVAGTAHKASVKLRDFFGDKAEPEAKTEAAPANDTAAPKPAAPPIPLAR